MHINIVVSVEALLPWLSSCACWATGDCAQPRFFGGFPGECEALATARVQRQMLC